MADGLSTPEIEYAKDPNIKKEDIQTLLEWASKQSHLPKITEFEFILFYHCTNYSLQATKDLVDLHYDLKNHAPELFPGPSFDAALSDYSYWDIAFAADTNCVTEEKYRVIYCGLLDPPKFNCDKIILEFSKIMFMLTLKKGNCPGYVLIFDMKGMALSHLSTLSLTLLRHALYFVQEAIPVKVRGVYMVNGHSITEKLMFMVKPFLKKELYDVIFVHSDINKMYQTSSIKQEFIPKEGGGTSPVSRSDLIAEMRSNMNIYKDKIREMMTKRTDRKKRSSNNTHSYDVEVLNGSFRKLEVD